MLRILCGVDVRDRISSSEVAERVDVESTEEWLRREHLRWFGYVLRSWEDIEEG